MAETGPSLAPATNVETPRPPDADAVRLAVRAVYAVFITSGAGFASWASRLPQIRDHLGLTPGALGVLLLSASFGAIIAMPLSGVVIPRLGEARTIVVFATVFNIGLALAGLGYVLGVPVVAVGLFLFGFGNGLWDAGMNVQAAAVEQAAGRPIMSRFHAGWSIGTVLGAGIGAVMIATGVPTVVHLVAVAVVLAVVVPLATRRFIPHPGHGTGGKERSGGAAAAWREPRTLLIGLFVLCMAFTEGTGTDWLNIAVLDGYHAPAVAGSVTFAIFLATMTTGRWFGPYALARFGRVRTLRVSALTAMVGLLLIVFGGVLAIAMVGAAVLGIGTSLGFPTGMSAASDDPAHAAARVSTAASIGYLAFLAGPPLIGFVGDHVGVLRGLVVTVGVLAVALLTSSALAPLAAED